MTPGFRDAAHRFIPARAGNTTRPTRRRTEATVHPRAGGEHVANAATSASGTGSSPRGRGTRGDAKAVRLMYRFIPARAGNTCPGLSASLLSSVHPRAGGEHSSHNCLNQKVFFSDKGRTTLLDTGLGDRCDGSRFRNRLLVCFVVLRGQGQELHKLQAIQVHWNTSIPTAGVEIVSSIVRRRPGDDRITIVDFGFYLFPDHLAGSSRVVSDVDTRPNFQQPYRQPAPQARRGVVNHDDQHRRSEPREWRQAGLPRPPVEDQYHLPPTSPRFRESVCAVIRSFGNCRGSHA